MMAERKDKGTTYDAEPESKRTSDAPAPGAFDTSDAVNVTTTLEEANEAGYLGAIYDDGDYTVAGVTA